MKRRITAFIIVGIMALAMTSCASSSSSSASESIADSADSQTAEAVILGQSAEPAEKYTLYLGLNDKDTFELLKGKHSFVVGGMEGMKYKEHEFYLEKGGAIFLYTDGVPEATNSDNALFGTDRLLTALNKDKNADPRAMLQNVKAAVDEFVGEAEQFDDLTMLGLIYKG